MAYSKISSETDDVSPSERLLEDNSDESGFQDWAPKKWHASHRWTVLNIGLLVVSTIFLVTGYMERNISDFELMKRSSLYSPVWDKIDLHLRKTLAKADLFDPPTDNKYLDFLTPNQTVTEAWNDLEVIRVFPITESELVKLGKDPEISVKFPPEYGLGDNAYMAQIDVFHQIHCLGLLRYQAWKEYDRDATLQREPYEPLHWLHLSHCTDVVLKALMCSASLDIITYVWMEHQPEPWPDFDVAHKCRNFDEILEWQDKHAVPKEWGRNVTRPKDFTELPTSELWYTLHNLTHEEADLWPDHHGHIDKK